MGFTSEHERGARERRLYKHGIPVVARELRRELPPIATTANHSLSPLAHIEVKPASKTLTVAPIAPATGLVLYYVPIYFPASRTGISLYLWAHTEGEALARAQNARARADESGRQAIEVFGAFLIERAESDSLSP